MPEKTVDELRAEMARSVSVCGCHGMTVTGADGKEHAELVCPDKETRDKAVAILEEEVILRVKPPPPIYEPEPEREREQ